MPAGKVDGQRHTNSALRPFQPLPWIPAAAAGLLLFLLYGGWRTGGWCGFEPLNVLIFTLVVLALCGGPLALIVVFFAMGLARRPFPHQPGGVPCCARCGYPREGLTTAQCPECGGSEFEVNTRQPARTLRRWLTPFILGSILGVLLGEAWALADDYSFQRDVRAGLYAIPSRPGLHHRDRWWPFAANGVYFNGSFGAHD